MSLSDFIQKYNGHAIDYDHSFGNQCVDLMNQYLVDCFGIDNPIQTLGGATAFEIYENANSPLFDKIANTPEGVPQTGDIIFWNTSIGSAGHVAIFVSGDANNFTSFDQNFPTGSLSHEQQHNYDGVAGWLRFKQAQVVEDTQKIIDDLRTARDSNWQLYKQEVETNKNLSNQIISLNDKISSLESEVTTLNGKITQYQKDAQDYEAQIQDLNRNYQTHSENNTQALTDGGQAISQLKDEELNKKLLAVDLNCTPDWGAMKAAVQNLESQIKAKEIEKQNLLKGAEDLFNLLLNKFWRKK